MAKFPEKEADIVVLAVAMQVGLEDNPTVYPAPPVSPANLQTAMDTFAGTKAALVAAQAGAKAALDAKNAALAVLVDDMKQDLRYAEIKVSNDEAKLKLLGWGAPAPGKSTPPGQTRLLEAPRQGEGWIFLDWKQPVDGGAVTTYRIQRRLRPDGPWIDAGLALESEAMLTGQERNKEWEYRVSAVNPAGDGAPSNTVMAVL